MFQMAFCYAEARKRGVDYYFQDPQWFDRYSDEIKALYSQDVVKSDYVGIHVRRGPNPSNPSEPNYHENPFYVKLTDTDYYKQAMALFPGEKFMVFSDDIEWCATQEIFKNCTLSLRNEIEDFNHLAGCKAVITANSSFSWWAGYLCGGKVVAPKAWYSDGVERTKCPKEWIRI